MWQTFLVGGARKRAGIAYPQRAYNTLELAGRSPDAMRVVYAEQTEVKDNTAALQFNCTQRSPSRVSLCNANSCILQGAHQNTLEVAPIVTLS